MDEVPGVNRFAPPAAHVDDIAVDGQGMLAGRGARLLAVIIDGLLGMGVLWIVSLVTPFHLFAVDFSSGGFRAGTVPTVQPAKILESLVVGLVVFLVLHGYLLHTRGQTIGKLAMNIRIVRSNGARASLVRLAGLRYFVNNLVVLIPMGLGGVYFLIDALLIFRAPRRCVHDYIADTIVVKA